jgi:iron complex outermembrane receptor protein
MMAERVEVLRGPASLLYGSNAMGGVINIVTDEAGAGDKVETMVNVGAGSWGTVQAEAMNRLRKGKFFSSVGGQYARSDNHRPNMGFEQYGGFLKLGYDFSEHWKLMGDASVTHFNASNPGTVTVPKISNDQWITRIAANVVLEHNFDRVKGAVSVYDNFGIHKIDDGYNANGGKPQTDLFRSKDALAGVSWYETITAWEGAKWTLGVDYQHIYGRAWYTDKVTGDVVTTKQRQMQSCHVHDNEVAGYVQYHQNLGERWSLDAGLRLDNHSQAGTEWVPQGGIVYRPIENGQIKAMVSKGFRNPTTREMYLYGTANSDSLKAESMMNYELSWHHALKNVTYGVAAFFIDGKNMIQTVAGRNINSGGFINKGVEGDAAWCVTPNLTLMTNHSYVYMHKPIIGAPRYKGYIGARLKYGKWGVLAGLQQLAHLCTEVDAKNGNTYTNATLLNMTVDYAATKGITLWAKGDNLLAHRYEINKGYVMPRATFMAGVKVKF